MMEALDSLASIKPSLGTKLIVLIGLIFPGLLSKLPDEGKGKRRDFLIAAEKVAVEVLERQMADRNESTGGDMDQSIIGSVSEYILFLR